MTLTEVKSKSGGVCYLIEAGVLPDRIEIVGPSPESLPSGMSELIESGKFKGMWRTWQSRSRVEHYRATGSWYF